MNYEMKSTENSSAGTEVIMTYTPARHNGAANLANKEFTYHVSVSGNIFHNREERNPVGFYGFDLEQEDIRRFRWDRVNEIVALAE